MTKVLVTIYVPEGTDLTELAIECTAFDATLESMDLPAEFETDNEELKGILPKPRRPKQ
jgi:hypothetical protein